MTKLLYCLAIGTLYGFLAGPVEGAGMVLTIYGVISGGEDLARYIAHKQGWIKEE